MNVSIKVTGVKIGGCLNRSRVCEYRWKLLTTRHFTLGTGEETKVADNSAQPVFLLEMAGNGIGKGITGNWLELDMVMTGIYRQW